MYAPFTLWRSTPILESDLPTEGQADIRSCPIGRDGALHAEQLVDLQGLGLMGRSHYAHARNPPYWRVAPGAIDALWVRASVAERLLHVEKTLMKEGLRLYIYDAWRPRAVQDYFFNEWTPNEMIRRRPDLSEDALREEVARYWAAPTADENAPAPHETGAAVDLALALEDGAPLFMGGVFDDPSPLSWARAFETADTAGAMALSHEEARANRRILFHAMRSADFVGLRSEWWHYSWGDQAWALRTGAKAAHYGLAGDPRS